MTIDGIALLTGEGGVTSVSTDFFFVTIIGRFPIIVFLSAVGESGVVGVLVVGEVGVDGF